MPQLKRLSCSIQWADTGVPFQEYGTLYGDGVVEAFIVVPNHPQPFNIRIKSRDFISDGLSVIVFIDGNYQNNRARLNLVPPKKHQPLNRTEIDFLVRGKEKPLGEGTYMSREWRFDNHNTVPELPQGVKKDHFDKLGTIEVLVRRCRARLSEEAAASSTSSAADSDVLADRDDGNTSDSSDEKARDSPRVTQKEELGGFDLFGLFGSDGANDDLDRLGMDGYISPNGPPWPPYPEQGPRYHSVYRPPRYAPSHQYPSSVPPHNAYRSHYSAVPQSERHVRFDNHLQESSGPHHRHKGSPIRTRPVSQERHRPSMTYADPSAYPERYRHPEDLDLGPDRYQISEPPDHPRYSGPQHPRSIHFPPHTNAPAMLGAVTSGHMSHHPTSFPVHNPYGPGHFSTYPSCPPWPPLHGRAFDPRWMAPHCGNHFFHPGPGWSVRPPFDPRTQNQTNENEAQTTGDQKGGQGANNPPGAFNMQFGQNGTPNASNSGQANGTSVPIDNNNTSAAGPTDTQAGWQVDNQDQGQAWGPSNTNGNDTSWNNNQNQTGNGDNNQNWDNNNDQGWSDNNNNNNNNNASGNGNDWQNTNQNTDWSNQNGNQIQQEPGVRPLFGPFGQYYTWSAQGPDAPKPDAEEEPRYDVPLEIAQAKGSSKQVQPGQGHLYHKKRCSPEYLDTLAEPYARFVFKYRTKEQVKNELGIDIPVEPTGDAAVQELQNMDKQALVDMVLRAKSALGGKIPSPPPKTSPSLSQTSNARAPVPVEPPVHDFLNYHISSAPRLNNVNPDSGTHNGDTQADNDNGGWGSGGGSVGGGQTDWNAGNAGGRNQNVNWNREPQQHNNALGWDGAHASGKQRPKNTTSLPPAPPPPPPPPPKALSNASSPMSNRGAIPFDPQKVMTGSANGPGMSTQGTNQDWNNHVDDKPGQKW